VQLHAFGLMGTLTVTYCKFIAECTGEEILEIGQ